MTECELVKILEHCVKGDCYECTARLAREVLSILNKKQSKVDTLTKQLEQVKQDSEQAISKCKTLHRVAESIMHDSFSYQVEELRGAVVDAVKNGEEYSKKLIETFTNQISEDLK